MVRPERFELPASWFVARRSIQLSYGRARGANITTSLRDRHSGGSRVVVLNENDKNLPIVWRRGRDSNPRWAFDPYALSRGAPSTTRPPLRLGQAHSRSAG